MDLSASDLTTSAISQPSPIEVIARIRPAIFPEIETPTPCLYADRQQVVTVDPSTNQKQNFDFDEVISPDTDNEHFYGMLLQAREQIGESIPTLFLSYGVTSAGKSFTLFGSSQQKGLFEYIIGEFFAEGCEISAVQIYLNNVSDLLTQKQLKVFGTGIDPLPSREWTPFTLENSEKLLSYILQNRETEATQNNSASSRSHCIIFVRSADKFVAFADLAGSEPYEEDAGKQILQEGAFIRTSLLMLDRSLKELKAAARGKLQSTSFRSSALTMALRPFLQLKDGRLSAAIQLILNLHANPKGFSANKETLNLGLVTKNARVYVKTPLRIEQSLRSVYSSCMGNSSVFEEGKYVKIEKEQWDGILEELENLAELVNNLETERENDIIENRNEVVQEMRELMEIEVNAERCEWIEKVRALEAQIEALKGSSK